MKIALTVGHSILKNGNYTSASGADCGGVNEYEYNKKLMYQKPGRNTQQGCKTELYQPDFLTARLKSEQTCIC